jgi:uncharacterized protein YjbI with pentapeptide repeats
MKLLSNQNVFNKQLFFFIKLYLITGILYAVWHQILSRIPCEFFSEKFWFRILYYDEPELFYRYISILFIGIATAFLTSSRIYETFKQNKIAETTRQDELFNQAFELIGSRQKLKMGAGVFNLISLAQQNPENIPKCLNSLLDINKIWMKNLDELNLLNNPWENFNSIEELISDYDEKHLAATDHVFYGNLYEAREKNNDTKEAVFELSKTFRQYLPDILTRVCIEEYFVNKPLNLKGTYLCGFDLSKLRLNNHLSFTDSNLNGIDASKTTFKKVQFDNVLFTGTDFSGAKFEDCNFERVYFNVSDLRFTQFISCKFKNCSFDACILDKGDYNFYVDTTDIAGEFFIQQHIKISEKLLPIKNTISIDTDRFYSRCKTNNVKRWSGYSGFINKRLDSKGEIDTFLFS